MSPAMQWLYHEGLPIYAAKTSNDGLVTLDGGGCVRVWETSLINIEKSLGEWRRAIGEGEGNLQITKERYSGLDVSGPKHGKVDEKNEPHVGGNTWAGGTGGNRHSSFTLLIHKHQIINFMLNSHLSFVKNSLTN